MVKNQAVAEPRRLQEELALSNRALETAYEEVRATTDELERVNAELQSTNEELETITSALQSAHKELEAMTEELCLRKTERDEVNDFLESLLRSHPGSLVVVDRDLRVSVWNERSAEFWGLRTDEVPGEHVLNLDIGLPVEVLRSPIRAVLAGDSRGESFVVAATNRRGRELRCRVEIAPLVDRAREIRGAIIVMEEDEEAADGS
jgi:two-component system, chemotaxis family, CheB/CheR fusion protein